MGSISNLFTGKSERQPILPPPPRERAVNDRLAASLEADRRRRRGRGGASTILTSPLGAPPGATARKTLTGQ